MPSETLEPTTALLRVLARLVARYALAGAVAFAALDVASRMQDLPLWFLYAAAVGFATGALSGSALAFTLALLAPLGSVARVAVVSASALAAAAYALHELGVVDRLSGRYSVLAFAAISGIALLCASFALLTLLLVPRDLRSFAGAQDSWLARASHYQRATVLGLLLLGAAAALLADTYVLVDGYPFLHEVLRKCTRIACAVALAQLRLPVRPQVHMATASGACAVASLALFSLSVDNSGALSALRKSPLTQLALSELRALGDFDADGFSAWLGGGDCAPFDPTVHPRARELPGNGIDDNCRLGDLAPPLPAPAAGPAVPARPDAPSIVLITIDTLRADHVGLYGYARPTTPQIDGFFAAGTRYADAVAPGSYTTISMAALMTGMYARHLHWQVALQTNRFRLFLPERAPQLEPGETLMNAHLISQDSLHQTLGQRLLALGYRTLAVVDDGGSGFLNQAIMGNGFEEYTSVSDESTSLWDPRGDEHVADRALGALNNMGAQPFLLWLHFFGVHAPDARHEDTPSFGDGVVDRYDHEIVSVDRQVGRVLAAVAALQSRRPLVAFLTADHGETFHGVARAHGIALSDAEMSVPLLARGPGFGHTTHQESVSLVDVVPTIMALVTGWAPTDLDGVSLLAPESSKGRIVLADLWRYDARGHVVSERVAAVSGRSRAEYDLLDNTLSAYARPSQRDQFPPPAALGQAVFDYLERAGAQPDNLLE